MDFRLVPVGQCALQRRQGQLIVQVTGQVPATDGACEDVHHHRQVHKLHQQAHIGDVRHPDLIGPHHFQVLNQVGVPGIVVLAIGGASSFAPDLGLQAHLLHQPAHALAIDDPLLVSSDLSGDPTIAVSRPGGNHLFNGRLELVISRRLGLVIIGNKRNCGAAPTAGTPG